MNRNSFIKIIQKNDMLPISEIKPILQKLKLPRTGNKKDLNDRLKRYYKIEQKDLIQKSKKTRNVATLRSKKVIKNNNVSNKIRDNPHIKDKREKECNQSVKNMTKKRNSINNIIISSFCKKGKRDYMEDRICIKKNDEHVFTGIFDGHGGYLCAEYLKNTLYRNILKEKNKNKNFNKAFEDAYIKTDKCFLKRNGNSGSTANCLYIDKKHNKFFVINTGDSRAFLCTKDNKNISLSVDHKPSNKIEKLRILNNPGGFVSKDDRVNGILAMSRAFGDKKLKNWVIVKPDIVDGIFSNIKFFVLASDGLYDVMSNYDISRFINSQLSKNIHKDNIVKNLVNHAIYDKNSYDNVSCIILYV